MLLQVSSMNPLESYHSELKRSMSSLHGLIGTSRFSFYNCFYSLLTSYISFTFNFLCLIHSLTSRSYNLFIYKFVRLFIRSFVCLYVHTFVRLLRSFVHLFCLGAVHNIVDLNCKKQSDFERAAFNFHTKKISVVTGYNS